MARKAKSGSSASASRTGHAPAQDAEGHQRGSKTGIKREEKREHIVRVSLRLFAKHGYDSTTIRMIAQEANMSLGLLYNYFDGKDSVLEEICRRNLEDLEAVYRIADSGSPQDRLGALLDQVFQHAQRHPQFHKLFRSLRNQSTVQQLVGKELRRFDKNVQHRLEGLMAELQGSRKRGKGSTTVDPAVDASLLYASIDGICTHNAAQAKGYPLRAVQQRLLEHFSN